MVLPFSPTRRETTGREPSTYFLMDRKACSFFFVGLLVGGMLTAFLIIPSVRSGAEGGAGSKIVLKLGHALDPSHPVHVGMEHMAQRLDELSAGTVELQIFPSGQLGSEPETIEQLQQGALAMVKTSTAAMEGFVPEMAVFGLPYLFRDEDHYWTVLNGPVGRELLAAGESNNVHGLCYYDSGSRSFYTIKGPVLSPADLSGLKIRTLPSRMAMDAMSTMGGAPTPIPWGELYTALQQGMVDGAENNPPSFFSSRHYEIAKHFSIDEHTRIPDMLICSKKVWDALPPHVRQWVNQAVADSVAFQRELWREKTDEALRAVEKEGVTIYHPDKASFVEATAPMYEQVQDPKIIDLFKRIRAVQ